jgi:PAS domain S-box-containing protein
MIDTSTPEKAGLLVFKESPVAQILVRYRRIVETNRAIEMLFGFARDELIDKSVQLLYPTIADFKRIGENCEATLRKSATRGRFR